MKKSYKVGDRIKYDAPSRALRKKGERMKVLTKKENNNSIVINDDNGFNKPACEWADCGFHPILICRKCPANKDIFSKIKLNHAEAIEFWENAEIKQ